jgi:hypothetical protein
MAADRLLQELTQLTYDARYRRLYEAGREARTNPRLAATIDSWEQGDWERRLYCVQSCSGSGDTARLRRMVDDPSRSVARHALQLLAVHADHDMLIDVLMQSTDARRLRLLKRLHSRRRFDAIGAFLARGFAENVPRIADLLPFGSARAVERHLPQALERGGSHFRERLARRHPRIAADLLLDQLATTEQPDGLLIGYARSAASLVGRAEPDSAVRLVRVLARYTTLSAEQLVDVLDRRPEQLAAIVLESEGVAPFSLASVAHKLPIKVLKRVLCEQPAALPPVATWFRKLASADRAGIFHEVGRSWRDAEGLLPAEVLALLPSPERVAESERIFALPCLITRPPTQAAYAAFLPWAKMREVADRLLTHPEGESRGWGWTAILTSLRFHRDHAGEILAMIRKRKFEQDPVRVVILQNLAMSPQGIWKAEHLLDIAGLIREALDATDLSYASVAYLTAFAQKLIPTHPKWAAEQLITIYRERGNLGGYYLEPRINNAQTLALEDAFIDVGKTWGKGNRVGWLVWFASALGKRLRICARLLKVLEELLGKQSGSYDTAILMLLHEHLPPDEFERLACNLIDAHESWVALRPIFEFLHRNRQDRLEPYLTKSKFKMKGGSTVELISLLPTGGYVRYTTSQQTALAGTLLALIRLPAGDRLPKDVWTMLQAMQFLALLPAIDPSRLIELSQDKRPVIADSAVRVLGRLDAGQGLPVLIEALGDQRGRLAIYALRQAMAGMPADRVVVYLRDVPLNNVTVAKEAIRLVGQFGGAAGFDWLLSRAEQNLHRDVRIALLRGLWDHLEQPQAWQLLSEATRSSDGQILNGVVRIPADRLSEGSRIKLIDLLAGLVSHPDAMVRLAVLRRFIEMPLPDAEGRLIQAALALLTAASSDERQAAAQVVAKNSTANDATRIADAVATLRSQRRFLHDFVRNVTSSVSVEAPLRRRLQPTARQVLKSLENDDLSAGLRLNLAAGILGAEGFSRELQALIDRTFPMAAVVPEATESLEQIGLSTERGELAPLENRLASSTDPHLRVLAFVALLAQAGDHLRWDDARRSRLDRYRNDASPVVAIRAAYYFGADTA